MTFTFLISLFIIAEASGLRESFNLQTIQSSFAENIILGTLIYIALFAIGNIIHIPGILFLVSAVIALGQVQGGIVTFIAANISCLLSFYLVSYVGGDSVRSLDHKFAVKTFDKLEARPILSIFLLRTIFQSLPALNYALALAKVKVRHYMAGTFLGLPIPIALYCYFVDFFAKRLL